MKRNTVWEVFRGKDLDEVVDRAHETLPIDFSESYQQVNVQFLNGEYVVTVMATRDDSDDE